MAPTGPEFAAANPGIEDMAGVGAFMTLESPAPGAKEDAVAILETELLLVGLPGRAGMIELGEAGNPAEGCFCIAGAVAVAVTGMLDVVGVWVGVEWFDDCDAVVLIEGVWWCRDWLARGPVYFSPSSPGAKVSDEQNPSEELISRVDPSLDLDIHQYPAIGITSGLTYHVRSVKVAKCRLLTTHNGFCCCVS